MCVSPPVSFGRRVIPILQKFFYSRSGDTVRVQSAAACGKLGVKNPVGMDFRVGLFDATFVPLGFIILLSYQLFLYFRVRYAPMRTVIGVNHLARRHWVESMMKVSPPTSGLIGHFRANFESYHTVLRWIRLNNSEQQQDLHDISDLAAATVVNPPFPGRGNISGERYCRLE